MKKSAAGGSNIAGAFPAIISPRKITDTEEPPKNSSKVDRLGTRTPPPSTDEKIQRILKKNESFKLVLKSVKYFAKMSQEPSTSSASNGASVDVGNREKIKFKPSPILQSPSDTSKKKKKEISLDHQDVIDDINKFEKTLKNFELDNSESKFDPNKDPKDYIAKIRARKKLEIVARQERDKRRRRALVEQAQAQKEMEEKKREELILEKLLKQSQEERKIAAKLFEVRQQKEVLRQNRILREQHYTERRSKEFEQSLERDAEIARKRRLSYEKHVQMEKERFKKYEEDRANAKKKKHWDICNRIVRELVDLGIKYSALRQLNDGELPRKEWNETKILFLAGKPVFVETERYPTEEEEILNEEELRNYLECTGEWKPVEESSDGSNIDGEEPKNLLLGKIVEELINLTTPEEPAGGVQKDLLAEAPAFPLKIAILGKPLSGKTTLAKEIAKKYKMAVIAPDELVETALQGLKMEQDAQQEEDGVASIHPLSKQVKQLAELAQISLKEGRQVDDKVLVGLVVEQIKALESNSEEIQTQNITTDRPTVGGNKGGWILDGFPKTFNQAVLLEKELTGYELPNKVAKRKAKRMSRLATPPQKVESAETPKSGLDLVLKLEITDDMVMRRAVGRRLDPVTGNIYHLEFNPPPVDHTLINERLILLPTDNNIHVQQLLGAHAENQNPLEEFQKAFENTKGLPASNQDVRLSVQAVDLLLQEIMQRKTKEVEKLQQEAEQREQNRKKEEIVKHEREMKEKEEQRKLEEQKQQEAQKKKEDEAGSKKNRRFGERKEDSKDKVRKENGVATFDASFDENSDTREIEHVSTPDVVTMTSIDETTDSIDVAMEKIDDNTPSDQSLSLNREIAQSLVEKWRKVESHFIGGAKRCFHVIREERAAIFDHFSQIQKDCLVFLNRPDTFQEQVDVFATGFLQIDPDMRDDPETKQELHQRVDDLKESLWGMCDKRKEEAEEEKRRIMKDGWVEDHLTVLLNQYITLMQVEVDRYFESRQLLSDYFNTLEGKPLEPLPRPVDLPFVGSSLKFRPPSAGKGKKKKKKNPPTSKFRRDDPFPDLTQTLEKALSLIQREVPEKKPGTIEVQEELSELEKALQVEDDILRSRLNRIREKALPCLLDLKGHGERTYQRLDEWNGNKFRKEVANVEQLVLLLKDIIESEKTLPSSIRLASTDLVILEETEIQKHPEKEEPVEEAELLPNRLGSVQLSKLAEKIGSVAPTGRVTLKELVDFLHHIAGTSKEFGTDDLPLEWINLTKQQFHLLLSSPQLNAFVVTDEVELVDWKKFLLAFAVNSLPTTKEHDEFAHQLRTLDTNADGKLSLEEFQRGSYWFEADGRPHQNLKSAIFKLLSNQSESLLYLNEILTKFQADKTSQQ